VGDGARLERLDPVVLAERRIVQDLAEGAERALELLARQVLAHGLERGSRARGRLAPRILAAQARCRERDHHRESAGGARDPGRAAGHGILTMRFAASS
jgi:hypothetical protein